TAFERRYRPRHVHGGKRGLAFLDCSGRSRQMQYPWANHLTGNSIAILNPGFKFSARIEPPCSSTALRAIARPRPVPADLVEKYGSKMRGRSSGGTPGPLSSTETTTLE